MTDDIQTFSTVTEDVPGAERPDMVGGLDNETILSQMRAEAQEDVEIEDISLLVPERPHFELLFHPNIDYDLLNKMMKSARKSIGGGKKEWHPLTFAYSIMSHTSIGLAYKGHVVQDSEGDDLTVSNPEFMKMFKARSPQQAIKQLYVKEGHIIATSQKIVEEAGYGDIDVESGEGGPLDD